MYNSIFVPEIEVDLPNYITELIIRNYCKFIKRPLPQSPFWRKEIAEQSQDLKDLSKRYQVELTCIKNLLLVFSPKVLVEYILNRNVIGIQLRKKQFQQEIYYDLCKAQIKFLSDLSTEDKIKIRTENQKSFTKTKGASGTNLLGKL